MNNESKNPDREARIAAIMAERSCTRSNALKHVKKEEADAVKAAKKAAKGTGPTAEQKATMRADTLRVKAEAAKVKADAVAVKAKEKADAALAKANAQTEKKAARDQKKVDVQATKQAAKDARTTTRAAANETKLADKVKAKADRATERQVKRDAKAAAKAAKVSTKKVLDKEGIIKEYQSGKTIGKIAKEIGASYMGIRLLLIREKVFGTVIAPPKEPVAAKK